MSRLLALEWDGREARVAIGRSRGKDLILEQAFAVDLGPREANQPAAESQIGTRLAAALAARNIGRGDAIVAVGRTGIELRLLTAPPAPEPELPDLVRFQAVRQFSALGENWPLDFVTLGTAEDGATSVLAAAISPDLVAQIKTTCEAGEITPSHLVLRPFAAASLVVRRLPDTTCRLLVDMLTDEADLTVLDGSQVVFIRTVRLAAGAEGEALAKPLLGEMRRTIVAAQNQLGGKAVERIVLCGDTHDHSDLKLRVAQELSLPVDLFDPFGAIELGPELRKDRPEHAGRFAPLLGILCDEAAGDSHAIDFLHPRRRPAPPDLRRRNVLIAAAAAVVLFLIWGTIWWQLRGLDAQIRELGQKLDKQKPQVKAASELEKSLSEIDKWAATDVPWLDELHRLSEKFPPGEEAVVTQLVASSVSAEGGQLTVDGKVIDSAAVAKLEQQLRDATHDVVGSGTSEDPEDRYPWRFKDTITVKPAEKKSGVAPTKPAAAGKATPPAKGEPAKGTPAKSAPAKTSPAKAPAPSATKAANSKSGAKS